MKAFRELAQRLRGTRGLELLALLLLLSLAGLAALRGGGFTSGGAQTALERRLEAVLQRIDGAGAVRVFVSEAQEWPAFSGETGGEAAVCGVLVVAEGADDVQTRLALFQAVRAVLPVEAERVEIVPMKRK